MAQQLEVSETVAQRSVSTRVVREVGIPSRLSPAERVVSVNARVEITERAAERGSVLFRGIIRATFYYASAEDPSDVVSIRRSFNFTDRVSVPGARAGYDVTIDALISDIDFDLINERLIGVEFTVVSDIEVTAPERVQFVEERPEIEFRRQRFRIRRELRERNFNRELSSVARLPREEPDIRRIVSIDPQIQLIDIVAGTNEVIVRGIVSNDVLYVSVDDDVEYVSVQFSFEESFSFRGVTPDMSPFVEVSITGEEAARVDNRRIRKSLDARFKILVVREEEVTIPTEIISPEGVFPVTRTVLIERIVAEERTRFQARDRVNVPEDNPAIRRIIRATGRLRGGTQTAEARSGGVLLRGTVDVNVIYVADLPEQPVYFTSTSIPFRFFLNISEVTSDMNVVADINVVRSTASRVSDRVINVRVTLDANVVVTERIRVPIITQIRERPVEEVPPTEEGFITYNVSSGDTLYLIAQRFGTTIQRLVEINNIVDPEQLEVGQQLLIPR
ncbi:MAG: DUF3794 domain-containing protein [Halanaerobiales bacterium]|nr:DUF3794 domain-containing protein [Halanaerobiales bacterium]